MAWCSGRRDPDLVRRQRAAAKALKNIKLISGGDDDSVFFEDVAGIGDAKVRLRCGGVG